MPQRKPATAPALQHMPAAAAGKEDTADEEEDGANEADAARQARRRRNKKNARQGIHGKAQTLFFHFYFNAAPWISGCEGSECAIVHWARLELFRSRQRWKFSKMQESIIESMH